VIDLNDIAVFVKVAQFESFSRAAHALGMPVSTVSRRVAALEEQLGATLLQRTTRKLSLTAQGRAYYDQCSEPLGHLYDAERVIVRAQREPAGLLRVSVPVIMGQEPFYDFVSSFLTTYPRIQVDLVVTNTFLDLVAENVDVAIRFGELQDSTIIANASARACAIWSPRLPICGTAACPPSPTTCGSSDASYCTAETTRPNGIW
jgi:DNA-binding transcriptional LysR family regulator